MPEFHPVQNHKRFNERPQIPESVALRAYEVYKHVYGAQEAMITGECRGGFAVSEIIAFLYAHSFPREEWSNRVNEAFNGMKGLA